jgi:hypothetical protein
VHAVWLGQQMGEQVELEAGQVHLGPVDERTPLVGEHDEAEVRGGDRHRDGGEVTSRGAAGRRQAGRPPRLEPADHVGGRATPTC